MVYYRRKRATYRRKRIAGQRKLNPRQKKQVKRLITGTQELKAIDTAVLQSPTGAGLCQVLTMPSQGDSLSTRDGDEILLKKLSCRLNVISADNTNIVRLIVFRWRADNTTAANVPIPTNILQNLNATAFYNYTAFRSNEMTILYDKLVALSSTGSQDMIIRRDLYGKNLGKKRITFDAAVITGTDQIYYLLISDSVAAPHPQVGGYFRLEYTDS